MSEPSAWAKAKAFKIVTSNGDCLLDDYPLDGLIDDIAGALDEALSFGAHRGLIHCPICKREAMWREAYDHLEWFCQECGVTIKRPGAP